MMKFSSFTRASLSSILQPAFSLRPKSGRPIIRPAVSAKPQTPLYLRPPEFRTTLSELKKWHIWAKKKISSVGSTFLYLDGGPEAHQLRLDLSWLVEDAIEQPAVLLHQNQWNDHGDDAAPISIRACLDDLYKLWEQRIEERRPIQYVVGCEHWRDLILSVEEGVFIPRHLTQFIVDLVDVIVQKNEELRNGVWADLGTGSGALAIGLGRILGPGGGRVVATDLSPVAVEIASYNVQSYHLQDRVAVRLGSWFEPLKDVDRQLSVLVSSPPCIPSQLIDCQPAEISKHEPRLALDGGPCGLNHLVHLCNGAASMLKPGGLFLFETNGETQSDFLEDYMYTKMKGNFRDVEVEYDLTGEPRFVTGYRA